MDQHDRWARGELFVGGVILNNLGRKRCTVALDFTGAEIPSITVYCDRDCEAIGPEKPRVRMEEFGYRWMRIGGIY